MLPTINGEFSVVMEPEIRFTDKGNAWAKIRCLAKDRVRDSNGNWADGDPLFIDVVVGGKQAQNIIESISKGDLVTVTGRLKQRNWEEDGQKKATVQISADIIGVSTRFEAVRTRRTIEAGGPQAAMDVLGATKVEQSDEAPF